MLAVSVAFVDEFSTTRKAAKNFFNILQDGLASFLDEDGDKKATINGRKLDLTSLGSTTAFAAEVQFLQTQSSFASDLFNFSKSLEQKLFSNVKLKILFPTSRFNCSK